MTRKTSATDGEQSRNMTEGCAAARGLEQLENRLTVHDFMKMQELFMVSEFKGKALGLLYNLNRHM